MRTPEVPDSVDALIATFAKDEARESLAERERRIRTRQRELAVKLINDGQDAYAAWIAEDARDAKHTESAYGIALIEAHLAGLAHALAVNVAGLTGHDDETGNFVPIIDDERAQFAASFMMRVVDTLTGAVELALKKASD